MLDRDANEFLLCAAVFGHDVELAESSEKVVSVGFFLVFDAEVIHHQCECHGVALMSEQTRCVGSLVIAVCGQMLDQPVLSQAASLWQAVYALVDLHDDGVPLDVLPHLVLVDDISRNVVEVDAHILRCGQWCAEVEILDVSGHELGAFIAHH